MDKVIEPIEEEKASWQKKYLKWMKFPNLLKTLAIATCTVMALQQITASFRKLLDIPITTYTHFDFNNTLMYPSLTFCREPPFKFDKLMEYGLYGHPRYTSMWRYFNFSAVGLDELWDDITYSEQEFFVQYGLDGLRENVEVTAYVGFVLGRCFTLTPRVLLTRATIESGYSVTLRHRADDVSTSISVLPPGYHLYIHYSREPFTEVEVRTGLEDYLYLYTGETVDVKLTVDRYLKLSRADSVCVHRTNYSAGQCVEKYVWNKVMDEVGCSGPWMETSVSRCHDYTSMKDLIVAYLNTYQQHHSPMCPRFCEAYLYSGYVTARRGPFTWDPIASIWTPQLGDDALQMQLFVHFTSMMVSVYEESYNYDWNVFVADLGGSIGFLLGLSVIGLVTLLAQLSDRVLRRPKVQDVSSISSVTTLDVSCLKEPSFLPPWLPFDK